MRIGFYTRRSSISSLSHKGEDIGKNLLNGMAEWVMDRVMTVTVDNASAMMAV
jgi:hypothetical protein